MTKPGLACWTVRNVGPLTALADRHTDDVIQDQPASSTQLMTLDRQAQPTLEEHPEELLTKIEDGCFRPVSFVAVCNLANK